ncbi:MAG TPA: hypothetical protein PLK12_03685 [Prolixibacteraceae bacterium]|nr:hypothetical protein [Prolixibacteraceae bacterium]
MIISTHGCSVRYKILLLNRPGGSNGFSARVLLPRALPWAIAITPLQGFMDNLIFGYRSFNEP